MADTRDERIRNRAHQIWEDAGRPEGLHEAHWSQAVAEIEAEDAASETVAKPRAAKKTASAEKPAVKKADGEDKPAAKKAAAAKPTASAKKAEADASAAKKPMSRKAKEAPVA